MRYQIRNGTVSLKGEIILNHINFEIRGNEKIALVGKNGAGKTTLLRLIAGELSLDRDDKQFFPGITVEKNTSVGILHQGIFSGKDNTVEEEMLSLCPVKDVYSKERYDFEQEYDRIFTGFGFGKKEKIKKIKEFSGGEQTKIAMIKLLLQKPDILLLDEPTNHLDMRTTEWMEDYIRHYEKAAVIVSHDRFFLDKTAEIVYELEDGGLTKYSGNYSEYKKQREKKRRILQKNYAAQQKEIERLTDLIEKFKHKPKKAAMARSKKKILDRMEKLECPAKEGAHIFTEKIVPDVPGSKWTLDADKLRIGYGDCCLQEITLRVRRGQKIGILGANGMGKTTLLRTIIGQIPALSGSFQLGNHIEIGYFDQHSGELQSEKRVFEHFHDLFPALSVKEVKQTLGKYLFSGEDTGKKAADLSGGEKSRLALAEILEKRPNFLILDEPTNHMDIPAKETLESAFRAYTGTMLFISHDRYFLKEVADALLIFEEEGVRYYPFGYEHYLEHLRKKKEFGHVGAEAVSAENTRLLESLQEVPEKTKMQGARFSTEQSYADWQLELAEKQLYQTKKVLEGFVNADRELFLKEWEVAQGSEEGKAAEESKGLEELSGLKEDVYPEEAGDNSKTGAADYREFLLLWEQYDRRREEERERLMDLYTEKCLLWYEKWQDYEEAFENYKDYH